MTTYACPGREMPQPPGAPFEGYLACYRAGHGCGFIIIVEEADSYVTTTGRCPCCGGLKWQMGEPASRGGARA